MNTLTTTIKSEDFAQSMLDHAVAISAQIHGSSGYTKFYMRLGPTVSGFPGIWSLCIDAAEEFTKQEIRILAEDEVDDCYSFDWLDAVDEYADTILKLEKNELDRSNLERIAHRIVWGGYGNQCPGLCRVCQPLA